MKYHFLIQQTLKQCLSMQLNMPVTINLFIGHLYNFSNNVLENKQYISELVITLTSTCDD